MIALVEGASRQKTPNEIALTILLAVFTLVFTVVCITLKPMADYSGTTITIAAFLSLFVCLIPTTIGGLLSAIGIAGMDRALRANVITKSGKAVETAGDVDTLYWTRRHSSLSETVRLQPFIRSKRFLCALLWKYACSLP